MWVAALDRAGYMPGTVVGPGNTVVPQVIEFSPHVLFGFSPRKSTSFSAAPKRRGECGAECHLSVHRWWEVVSA